MYGGMDRSAYPDLKKADEDFIASTTKHYGSRQAAAQHWVEQAFSYHQRGNWPKAMARFNQAWLLDPENPEVYWGFGALLHDQGENCEAMEMVQMADEVGLDSIIEPNRAMLLADLGMITSACLAQDEGTQYDANSLAQEADAFYVRSEEIGPTAYLYDKWWKGLYWREQYAEAWEKVELLRGMGVEPQAQELGLLEEEMPEPAD